jgi:glycosidase
MNHSATQPSSRPLIYQLFVRLFGNTKVSRKMHGTIAENGCGKFADISVTALASIRAMGFTHVWLTGVLEHASGTAYPDRPADDADILKGIAGSPYAIRDYFDVCPDYAIDPLNRLGEFRDLVERCHANQLKVLIDFVPNHVARTYLSDVRPELSFGEDDDTGEFFHRHNHFYYLRPEHPGGGPPLKLPTAHLPGCNGRIAAEMKFGRVTGNNAVTWAPSIHDWYETVKLNYGHDFTLGRDTSHLPGPDAEPADVPRTWRTMDEIMAYWQEFGVDGFRVDMAHMVPLEFWRWMIRRARQRNPDVFYCAEAYDGDPAKLTDRHALDELLRAGFAAVYDHPAYRIAKEIYDGENWANDFDSLIFASENFHQVVRYAENHDEVRLASQMHWGGVGMEVGKAVCAILYGMGRGPILFYNGQEIGEPGEDAQGFSDDDGRTSIFDYTAMPEFIKWVNGGRFDGGKLSERQKKLRAWYAKLLRLMHEPAFCKGGFYGLNHANRHNPSFGRGPGEEVSGHWMYAYLRYDPDCRQAFLVVVNLHGSESMRNVRIQLPEDSWSYLGITPEWELRFIDRLAGKWTHASLVRPLAVSGVPLPDMPPCSALFLELTSKSIS